MALRIGWDEKRGDELIGDPELLARFRSIYALTEVAASAGR